MLRRSRLLCTILTLATLWVGLGCSAEAPVPPAAPSAPATTPPPSAAVPTRSPTEEAKQIFQTRCATCHGADGAGEGAASAGLDPKPRNFGDSSWQQSVSDEHIERIILAGGAAVGRSALMPPNPDLASKPEVIAALRAQVRSFAKR